MFSKKKKKKGLARMAFHEIRIDPLYYNKVDLYESNKVDLYEFHERKRNLCYALMK